MKEYLSEWGTWKNERAKRNLRSWLDGEESMENAVSELTVFKASRCLSHKNHGQTIKGYLAVITYAHELFEGLELLTSHLWQEGRRSREVRIETVQMRCPSGG